MHALAVLAGEAAAAGDARRGGGADCLGPQLLASRRTVEASQVLGTTQFPLATQCCSPFCRLQRQQPCRAPVQVAQLTSKAAWAPEADMGADMGAARGLPWLSRGRVGPVESNLGAI